jgi:membrane protease YdiL (CAAX protease family)
MPDFPEDLEAAGKRSWRTEQLLEAVVVLLFIVPGSILANFVRHPGGSSFVIAALGVIAHDVAQVCLIWFFLWRNGESVREVGWSFKHRRNDVLLGLALFLPLLWSAALLDMLLRAIGLGGATSVRPAFLLGPGSWESLLASLMVVVVAFSEETVFRGFLLSRFRALSPDPAAIVLLSSVIFALGHGYEGAARIITVGAMGAIFAAIFLWRGSLVAPMVMHFLQDFLGIVVLPYLKDWAGRQ